MEVFFFFLFFVKIKKINNNIGVFYVFNNCTLTIYNNFFLSSTGEAGGGKK